ncbi:class I SAM-dependent methyltransferase [Polaribacter aestuariivivens]|uniref:Class I SAM-dependent methyltransferase n=1 Tax=Polaribacter aestuariivivens TaxID=2304626 RepID=A0A5S3N540_9FLAO|nr:class I SAM-dependent methyltransferase [Polaribacter aestuariivivens]TMM30370.1 class I SAM-dependent methyltransferase [Polaribacter aestuariivivens]
MENEKELYKNLVPFLNCKDHTVSGEFFEVMKNEEYEMLVTSPVPSDLDSYYKSDNYISHTDSKKSFIDKIYQIVKSYTLKRKLSLINSFETEEKQLLDIGAGTGDFLKTCKKKNWKVFGVEPNPSARNIALKKGIDLKENISDFTNEKFDVITLWHVLEHMENLKTTIKKLKSLLKPKGRIVVAVPNYKSCDANFYKEHWAAFDVPRHLWHFSQFSIHKLFSEVEMIVDETLPMKFDSFYVALLSEKYKTGKLKPFLALHRGFASNLNARTSSEYSSLIYIIKNY